MKNVKIQKDKCGCKKQENKQKKMFSIVLKIKWKISQRLRKYAK